LNVPETVGVPLMLMVLPTKDGVTPAGKPVAVPMPVAPVVICVIAVNGVLIHKVGVEEAVPAVLFAVTVIVPVAAVQPVPVTGIE
jgi:hypothetical protein